MDSRQAALRYLGSLCDPPVEDPSEYFKDGHLDSWVRYYNDFLSSPKNAQVIKSSHGRNLNATTIACFVYLIKLIYKDLDGVTKGKWAHYIPMKKLNEFSIFNYALNLCGHIKNSITSTKNDCWLSDSVNEQGYPQFKFTECEIRMDTLQQGTRILSVKDGYSTVIIAHRWACSLKYKVMA